MKANKAVNMIDAAEQNLNAAIREAIKGGDIAMAERIRNAAFHVANIVGVKIKCGEVK